MPQNSQPNRYTGNSPSSVLSRRLVCCMGLLLIAAVATISIAADSEPKPAFTTELVRGQVVWLADALKSEFGISTVPEVAESSLALLTKTGQLLPIVENLRGRAFRKDDRLREMEVEILARRYQDQPFIQVLKLFEIDGQDRYEVDYWCDVCAIVMFEAGPCACCQDDNRMRKRPAPKPESERNPAK